MCFCLCVASFFLGNFWNEVAIHEQDSLLEQRDDCFDSKKYEAYIARKGTELRCFELQRQWPHRVRSSVLE